ncbi:MAG TPA: LssY C-terminal domain-containing protein [Bryobacteraceae bacterium]|nr:LssY C-terminal domain-containing protein [Bryobacteraceae bacterium]
MLASDFTIRAVRRLVFRSSILLALALTPCFAGLHEAIAPPTWLQVRLQTHLTSYKSRAGTRFQCVVISPYEVNGSVLIPQNSIVYGTVRRAQSVRLGILRERAGLDLDFSRYQTPDGATFALSAKLAAIDNARELVGRNGHIKGVLAATNPEEVLNGIWEKPAWNMLYRPLMGLTGVGQEALEKFPIGPVGPGMLFGVRCLLMRFPEPEIHLTPGTDLSLKVDASGTVFQPKAIPPAPDLPTGFAEWLAAQPFTVEKPNGRPAEDVINIVFLGSREDVLDSFNASGWHPADATTFNTFSRLYLAYNSKRTYDTAPVSKLFYKGQLPDMVFEKSFDTVSKRHHIRIWNAGVFEGQQVWLAAATHDTGIYFDHRSFHFSHRIDKNLDDERSKIAVDLTYSGCAQSAMYAARFEKQAPFSRGSPVMTDGEIAVLPLQSCRPADYGDDPGPGLPGNKVTRLIRRVILEARTYVVRENVYYWGFEIIRHSIHPAGDMAMN